MHRRLNPGQTVPAALIALLLSIGCVPAAWAKNSPPRISGTPSTDASVGNLYQFRPTATDPDGDVLTFVVTRKPGWAAFDPATGTLSGTPAAADVGTYSNIRIGVSDGQQIRSLKSFSVTVAGAASITPPSNLAPTITGVPSRTAVVGTGYTFQPTATDPEGQALTYSIRNRPTWASFSTSTGRLWGTPQASHVGSYAGIVISVSDGSASSSLPSFAIDVTAAANRAPAISGTPPTSVTAGQVYVFQPSASDADGDELTFAVQNRPSWATFEPATGRLSGTPTASQAGTHANVTISVTDGEATSGLAPFSITVAPVVTGTATLRWTPPTLNTDGTPLTDLADFRVDYGQAPGSYSRSLSVGHASITSVEIQDLAPGTWYFAVKAVSSRGIESDFSNEAAKVID